MKVQSIQPTPNPNAFKFVVDGILHDGTKHYSAAGEARGYRLAEELFAIEGVDTLFFCDRFVTVSMLPSADWRAVHEQATRVIEAAEAPAAAPGAATAPGGPAAVGAAPAAAAATAPETEALLQRINDVLDDRVRPALAGDGGGLEVVGLDGKTLQIRYQGACGSCPSSIAGTLMAIQNLLQSEVDEDLAVVPA